MISKRKVKFILSILPKKQELPEDHKGSRVYHFRKGYNEAIEDVEKRIKSVLENGKIKSKGVLGK